MASLTTHVLNLADGKPASRVKIDCLEIRDGEYFHLKTDYTNEDGRLDAPIVEEGSLHDGTYELVFHIGDYFKERGVDGQPFLQTIPVRFGVEAGEGHYHVPLLVSPFGYQVYRGS